MSKTTETTLSLLLKLSAGLLDETRAKRVRHKIESDPLWRERWLRLREFGFDSEISIEEPFVECVDPEIIGQFVEQRLPTKTALQLESMAWKKPELLREIAITFQHVYLPETPGKSDEWESDSLYERVVGMVPARVNGHSYELKQHVSPVATPDSTNDLEAWRFSTASLIAIAASLFLLAILVAVSLNGFSADQQLVEDTNPRRPEVKQHDNEPVQDVDFINDEQLPELAVDDKGDEALTEVPTDRVVDNEPDADEGFDFPIELLIDDSDEIKSNPNKSIVESNTDTVPESIYNPIQPHWTQFHGAIGLREPGQDVIQGYGFVDEITPEMEIQVFPMSWAQADVSGLGQIVVNGDSIFKIGSRIENSDGHQQVEQIEISLRQGRLAIVGMVPDTRVLLKTGSVSWPVTVSKNDSAFVVERVAADVRVFARQGKIQVRGEELGRNRQMILQNGSFGKPEKTKLATKWVDRPNLDHQLPETIKQGLFNSANLTTALGQLQRSSDGQTRIAAMQWRWAAQPSEVVQVFKTHDVANWVEAMNWLVEQSPDHFRTRMIWRQLADGPGNPEIAREFMRWVGLRANNRLPTPPHLKKMIEFLGHDRLFVRFVATYLLEKSFGNPPGYRPQAPANVRSRAMHVWRQYIAEVYKRKVESAVMND